RVTLVHRGGEISRAVKYWIKPNIENRIKAGEIKAYFHSRIVEIRPQIVVLATPEGEVTLKNERDGIYLAGVIVAGMHTNEIFIENGRFHGAQIAEAIAAKLVS